MTYRSKLDSKRVIMYKGDIILKLVAVLAVVLVAVMVAVLVAVQVDVQVAVQVLLMLDRLSELLKIQLNLALFELKYLDLHFMRHSSKEKLWITTYFLLG